MTTTFNFLPHTAADRQAMLARLGLTSQEQLFEDIPLSLRQQMDYQVLPTEGLSELELQAELKALASRNQGQDYACFLGGGAYNRFIPMVVNTIASRSEFYTAYTPYQPEISQGTLQVVYEFQSMICELTGMDVANASVYDGASAVTEAALMAVRATRRKRVLIAQSVHPEYRQVLQTYVNGLGEVTLESFSPEAGLPTGGEPVACVIVQRPNYFGGLEDPAPLAQFCRQSGALLVVSADPVSLALLQPPGEFGADIVVGDIQPLGNNLAYGGPYGGYIATRQGHLRQLPGRLVGRTVESVEAGETPRPCYTLTLQTREQHIRREKATSNICTNQALNVLKATVYLALMGPQGLREVATLSVQRSHWLAEHLTALPGVSLAFPEQPFFSEFVLKLPVAVSTVLDGLEAAGILGGIPVELPDGAEALLVSCTEMTTPEQLSAYVAALSAIVQPSSLEGASR